MIEEKYRTTAQLLRMARRDPDPVSGYLNGDSIETTQEAVYIVKGNRKVRQVQALLTGCGLMSSAPVNPPGTAVPPNEAERAAEQCARYIAVIENGGALDGHGLLRALRAAHALLAGVLGNDGSGRG